VFSGSLGEQHQALVDDLGREEGGEILNIMRRAERIHVDRNDIETSKAAQKLQPLARRQPASARCRNSRSTGWVKDVHVEAQINRPPPQLRTQFRGAHIAREHLGSGFLEVVSTESAQAGTAQNRGYRVF
jgi:hypothetical protein